MNEYWMVFDNLSSVSFRNQRCLPEWDFESVEPVGNINNFLSKSTTLI